MRCSCESRVMQNLLPDGCGPGPARSLALTLRDCTHDAVLHHATMLRGDGPMRASALVRHLNQPGLAQHRLPASVALAIGLLAAGATLVPALWVASQHLYTVAHEGGHAFVGSAVGRRVLSVSMNAKGEGL